MIVAANFVSKYQSTCARDLEKIEDSKVYEKVKAGYNPRGVADGGSNRNFRHRLRGQIIDILFQRSSEIWKLRG
jgi:DNA-binding Lrp family transcriptional regulator